MAVRGVINEFFNLEDFQKQLDAVVKGVQSYIDLAGKVPEIRASMTDPTKIKETADATKKLADNNKEAAEASKLLVDAQGKLADRTKDLTSNNQLLLDSYTKNQLALKQFAKDQSDLYKAYQNGLVSQNEYLKKSAEIKDNQLELSTVQKQVVTSLNNLEKQSQSSTGSLDELNATLNIARQAYRALSDEEKASPIGEQAKKSISDLVDQIREEEKGIGDFSKNVGRYGESLAAGFNQVSSEIDKLKSKQKELSQQQANDPSGFATRGGEMQIVRVTNAIDQLNQVQNISLKTGQSYNTTLRQLEKSYVDLAASGEQSNEFLNQFKEFIAQSKQEAGNLTKEIKALSSETRGFDLLTGAVTTLAAGFELGAGASALFGEKNEDIERSIKKLIAIQSVARGIQELAKQATEKTTLAGKAYNFVLQQGSILLDKGSTSAQKFGAALKGIVIFAIIGAIITLIQKFSQSAEASKELTNELDDLGRQSEEVTKQIELLNRQAAYLKQLGDITIDLNVTGNYEQQILKAQSDFIALQESIGGTSDLIEKATKINDKAFADFLENASASTIELVDKFGQIKDLPASLVEELSNKDKKLVETAKKTNQALFDLQISLGDKQKQQFIAGANIRLITANQEEKIESEKIEALAKLSDKERKDALELFKFRQGLLIEEQKRLVQTNTGKPRDNARIKQAELEKEMIKQVAFFELSQGQAQRNALNARLAGNLISQSEYNSELLKLDKITSAQRLLIEQKKNKDISNIDFDRLYDIKSFAADEQAIILNSAKETSELLIKQDAEEQAKRQQLKIDNLNKSFAASQKAITDQASFESVRLSKQFKEGEITKEQYEKKKTDIEVKARRKSLEDEVKHATSLALIANLSAEDQLKAYEELNTALAGLRQLDVEDNERTEEQKRAEVQKTLGYIGEYSGKVTDIISGFIGAAADKEKNRLQDQIDKLEETKAKDIEVANQTITNEQDKADTIAVINARADAKKEQLQLKQRQADERKARFDKAAAIAKIIVDTAKAVVEALPNIPLAVATGIIGAAELALAIATPIPKFAKGGVTPGGPVMVGDGGKHEAARLPDGTILKTPDVSTIWDLPKGTVIDPDFNKMMISATLTGVPEFKQSTSSDHTARAVGKMERSIVKAITDKQENHWHMPGRYDMAMRDGSKHHKYMNDNL
jgi:hypothetical protein